jgi:hypothetical protein
MNKLSMGGIEDLSDHTSEVFSIGLTVLSAAKLMDFSNLYNIKLKKFAFAKAN